MLQVSVYTVAVGTITYWNKSINRNLRFAAALVLVLILWKMNQRLLSKQILEFDCAVG